MLSRYRSLQNRLANGETIILDGGIGTELERRGALMSPEAWCGPATLGNLDMLETIYRDYIAAGADIITANTYASSRVMLSAAGMEDQFEAINKAAVAVARKAAEQVAGGEVLVAGSLSHMVPIIRGQAVADARKLPAEYELEDTFGELAFLLRDNGCDLILLEMMYDPIRMDAAFSAAAATGLPIWAGFSARMGTTGSVLSYLPDRDLGFSDMTKILKSTDVDVAGVMHTASDLVGDAIEILKNAHGGPYMAYPDSGHFEMPHWRFEDIIRPERLAGYARSWIAQGVQIVGGCCGISPEHIMALSALARK